MKATILIILELFVVLSIVGCSDENKDRYTMSVNQNGQCGYILDKATGASWFVNQGDATPVHINGFHGQLVPSKVLLNSLEPSKQELQAKYGLEKEILKGPPPDGTIVKNKETGGLFKVKDGDLVPIDKAGPP